MVHNYLEPRLCRPRLQVIHNIVSKRLFKGPERESDFTQDLYSFEKLLSIVQASEEEIKLELEDLNAIEYQGIF
jgi:Sister chromatid cohesion protein Dcc1